VEKRKGANYDIVSGKEGSPNAGSPYTSNEKEKGGKAWKEKKKKKVRFFRP